MLQRYLAKTYLVSATGMALLTGTAGVGCATDLIAHRAIYDLVLKHANDTSGIEDMYGRMVYEFTGSACKGYNVKFRFMTAVDMGGERRLTDQQTLTYEDLKAGKFKFETKSYSNNQLNQDVQGEAKSGPAGLLVNLMGDQARKIELAKSAFPTEQMIDVIDRAQKGEHFFETRVFDGSDTGDKSLYTTTVVGNPVTPKGVDGDSAKAGMLADKSYWPVTVAYFDDKTGKDQLPTYRVAFKLYDNGVTRDLTMDYGDFVLTGKLSSIEFLKEDGSCS
jgi:hypothetical protein